MMNLFPILYFTVVGHLIVRVFLGCIFVYLGFRHLHKDKMALHTALSTGWPWLGRTARFIALKYALFEIIVGGMFIVGIATQAAAILGIIASLKMLIFRRKITYPLVPSPLFWVLALAISASLLVTGAGAFAFDYPI